MFGTGGAAFGGLQCIQGSTYIDVISIPFPFLLMPVRP